MRHTYPCCLPVLWPPLVSDCDNQMGRTRRWWQRILLGAGRDIYVVDGNHSVKNLYIYHIEPGMEMVRFPISSSTYSYSKRGIRNVGDMSHSTNCHFVTCIYCRQYSWPGSELRSSHAGRAGEDGLYRGDINLLELIKRGIHKGLGFHSNSNLAEECLESLFRAGPPRPYNQPASRVGE